jgi:hypothetical protein
VALAIFLFSLWLGSHLGSSAALYWYRHKQREKMTLHEPEHVHFESVLSELGAVQNLQIFSAITAHDKELGKKYLLDDIGFLEGIKRKSDLQEIEPAIDFNLGRAFVYLAMAETNNGEQATQHMKTAQTLFQSLGWTDYTEGRLRTLAVHELDKWNPLPPTMEQRK